MTKGGSLSLLALILALLSGERVFAQDDSSPDERERPASRRQPGSELDPAAETLRERERQWESLSREQQQEICRQYQRFQQLDEEKRREVLEKLRRLKELPAETQRKTAEGLRRFRALDEYERFNARARSEELRRRMEQAPGMRERFEHAAPDERSAMLERLKREHMTERFAGRLSPEQRQRWAALSPEEQLAHMRDTMRGEHHARERELIDRLPQEARRELETLSAEARRERLEQMRRHQDVLRRLPEELRDRLASMGEDERRAALREFLRRGPGHGAQRLNRDHQPEDGPREDRPHGPEHEPDARPDVPRRPPFDAPRGAPDRRRSQTRPDSPEDPQPQRPERNAAREHRAPQRPGGR